MRQGRKPLRSAFTLVEMLVVVGIIAVLIALLLPLLNNVARIRESSRTMVFVEEFDPRGYNLGSFLIFNAGDLWIDYPVSWHNRGACVSLADGHVEYFRWADPRTVTVTFLSVTPGNPDLKMLQKLVGY